MKTFRMALAALALLAVSLPIRANTSPTDIIHLCTQAVEAKKVVVQVTNLAEKTTQIRLESAYGDKVYYQEYIRKHNGHRALLDLGQLPEGRYILSVSQKGETKSQVIRITEGRVMVSHCIN